MSEQTGPQEIFARFRRNVLGGGLALTEDMLAADVVVEMPFLPPALPRRVEGREAFLAFSKAGREGLPVTFTEFRDVVLHQTTDPEVLIAEYVLAGRPNGSDEEYAAPFVVVMRVREGRVVHWREYQDMAAMAQAAGGLPEV
ncbi:nuclear transport factor 2 family protein [Spirillospora sp. CA-253888]